MEDAIKTKLTRKAPFHRICNNDKYTRKMYSIRQKCNI